LAAIILCLIVSCDDNRDFFPTKKGKKINYKISFLDKENNLKEYRQSFIFLSKDKNLFPMLGNDGRVIFFEKNKNGLVIDKTKNIFESFITTDLKDVSSPEKKYLLKFPLKKNNTWENTEKTQLMMKIGYDRVFHTFLPFKMRNEIVDIDDTLNVDGKKIKNCIKVIGIGQTSYNPGPPLGNINIEIRVESWFAPNLGLIKYTREEKADSETMGKIFFDKVMELED